MRKLLFILMLFSMHTIAQDRQFYLMFTEHEGQTVSLLKNPSVEVNYLGQGFALATSSSPIKGNTRLITPNAWADGFHYYLIFTHPESRTEYLEGLTEQAKLIHVEENFVVAGFDSGDDFIPQPAKSDGMVRLWDRKATMPARLQYTKGMRNTPDPFIASMIEEVDASLITATVQHLEDYGTRNAYTQQSVQAQNWIADEFESMGLEVELMNFSMPGGSASDNVIATLTGTLYPQEYVVVGAHYDSYSNSGAAPGADDNASGTAGVLEIARIMSQYSFDRTLVFCAFSGEEYGLYGSEAYANRCAQQGMDIHGYFNLDMIGYLQNGSYIHTDLIYPASAQELADFYTDICGIYLPGFLIEPGMLQGGDSDHTSFNNNGFMGIFPFEDSQNYSPYIHTSNDLVGPSYNNSAQARVFVQASLASAASLANRITPPRNLKALGFDNLVRLSWTVMEGVDHYNIYRDNNLIGGSETAAYEDFDVVNDTEYQYQVSAVFAGTDDESDRSAAVSATPRPLLALPYADDFEAGDTWWETSQSWGLTSLSSHSPSHSLADSPNGAYQNNVTSYAYLRPFGLNGDFEEATASFWTRFDLESGYDYVYFELSSNGENWIEMASFNGIQQNWQKKTYSLNNYLGSEHVQLRFRFYSDSWVTGDGIFIDDFEVSRIVTALPEHETAFTFYPNPATDQIRIVSSAGSDTRIVIMDALGRQVMSTVVETPGNLRLNSLIPGVYMLHMISETQHITTKLVVKSYSAQ
jgi:hypothetical protein